MKKKTFFDKFMISGIWIQPIVMTAIVKYLQANNPRFLMDEKNWALCLLISFVPALLIWSETIGKPSEDEAMTGKHKAMYPMIPKELLRKELTGTIPLGWDNRSKCYVCKPLEEDGHVFLIGASCIIQI